MGNTETDSSDSWLVRALQKRVVLIQVSCAFHPLGVLAPFLLPAKCLIQSLWRTKKDWDEPLDGDDKVVWEDWLADLSSMRVFELPRCLCSDAPQEAQVELHVFGHAPEKGFGAVCYTRHAFPHGRIEVAFHHGQDPCGTPRTTQYLSSGTSDGQAS